MNRLRRAAIAACMLLGACASTPPALPDADVLVFGEQHDQPDQQRQVARVVERLAAEGRLAAVVIEMAAQGQATTGLPRDADAARVREALAWTDWDWPVYEGVVMAAVRAGVPVLGGNLPRAGLRETMADASRDAQVDPAVRAKLATEVREGHCGLLPAEHEPGMVRVQIARDASMAATVAGALEPGRQVVLLAGAQHASRDRGVPLHLAKLDPAPRLHVVVFSDADDGLVADARWPARHTPRPDPCEELARQLGKAPPKS